MRESFLIFVMNSTIFHNWLNVSSKSFNQGLNFGHKSTKSAKTNFWHPLMSHSFLGIRHNVSLFSTHQTLKCVLRAFHIIALILRQKGRLLIVNTNPEFFRLCNNLTNITLLGKYKPSEQHSTLFQFPREDYLSTANGVSQGDPQVPLGIPHFSSFPEMERQRAAKTADYRNLQTPLLSYVSYKWVGGTLTNWKQISKSVLTFAKFSERCETFLVKNGIDFPKYTRVKKCFQGLLYRQNKKMVVAFHQKPDLIFLINPHQNQSILNEACRLNIPVIAFVESSTNPKDITYPIPVNNYSIKFMYFCLKKIIKMAHI